MRPSQRISGLLGAGLLATAAASGAWAWPPADLAPPADTAPSAPYGQHRGYVDSGLGQVHYVDVDPGRRGDKLSRSRPAVVLLHQTPWFHVFYVQIQMELARRGWRSVSIDTPGYGFSSTPVSQPSAEQYAESVHAVIKTLRLTRPAIVGHHTGSVIGTALASAHPGDVRCLVLHGPTVYGKEYRDRQLQSAHFDQSLADDGSQLTRRYQYLRRVLTRVDEPTREGVHWGTIAFFLAGKTEYYGHDAAFSYDMEGALRRLDPRKIPVLIVSNTGDMSHQAAQRARAVNAAFEYTEFTGGTIQFAFEQPVLWTDRITEYLNRACR
jgi:pimeloyl-ACP methyl ester carboxylesterase